MPTGGCRPRLFQASAREGQQRAPGTIPIGKRDDTSLSWFFLSVFRFPNGNGSLSSISCWFLEVLGDGGPISRPKLVINQLRFSQCRPPCLSVFSCNGGSTTHVFSDDSSNPFGEYQTFQTRRIRELDCAYDLGTDMLTNLDWFSPEDLAGVGCLVMTRTMRLGRC